ncbi:hypothetical protein EMEDMD4_1170011 [Sinorhizobium medicae]|uniref:Uncharacterized protein n=2 Tax=Sinorhizobium medicae TaxID=110321 RepID=A0A508WQN9_9HYPH|nr:hypothetical protein EMEDMD4_1170011 [Sinorhizobium medicae]
MLAATAQNLRRLAKLRPVRECPREGSNKFAKLYNAAQSSDALKLEVFSKISAQEPWLKSNRPCECRRESPKNSWLCKSHEGL